MTKSLILHVNPDWLESDYYYFFYIVNFFLPIHLFFYFILESLSFFIFIYIKKHSYHLNISFYVKKRERERDCSIAPAYLVSNEEGMVRDVRRHKCPMDVCAPTTSQVREHHFPIVKSLGHNFQRHTTPPKQVWIE
jgi:hypothetical protein